MLVSPSAIASRDPGVRVVDVLRVTGTRHAAHRRSPVSPIQFDEDPQEQVQHPIAGQFGEFGVEDELRQPGLPEITARRAVTRCAAPPGTPRHRRSDPPADHRRDIVDLDDVADQLQVLPAGPPVLQVQRNGVDAGVGLRFGDDQPATRAAAHPRDSVVLEQPNRFAQNRSADVVAVEQVGLGAEHRADRPAAARRCPGGSRRPAPRPAYPRRQPRGRGRRGRRRPVAAGPATPSPSARVAR